MIDYQKLTLIFIQSGSFISAFAAITAGIVMATITKKFRTGVLASGFKINAIGVSIIALGILIDAVQSYIQFGGYSLVIPQSLTILLICVKYLFFIIGTYAIVIGSKRIGDRLEHITK